MISCQMQNKEQADRDLSLIATFLLLLLLSDPAFRGALYSKGRTIDDHRGLGQQFTG